MSITGTTGITVNGDAATEEPADIGAATALDDVDSCIISGTPVAGQNIFICVSNEATLTYAEIVAFSKAFSIIGYMKDGDTWVNEEIKIPNGSWRYIHFVSDNESNIPHIVAIVYRTNTGISDKPLVVT